MSVLHPASTQQTAVPTVTPPPPSSPRLVAAVVCGQRIAVPCPDWCVTDHTAENLVSLKDLSHYGPQTALAVPQYSGAPERVLIAYMAQWPFAADEHRGQPYMALEACDDGDVTELRRAAVRAMADQTRAHADALDAIADQLPEESA